MNIYHYSPQTTEYTYSSVARTSPLEPGVFLVPAFATTLAPPRIGANQAALFNGRSWLVVDDYRGEWYSHRTLVVITEFGPLPQGYTAQPAATTIQEAVSAKINNILAQNATEDVKPFEFPVGSGVYYKHTEAVILTLAYCDVVEAVDGEPIPVNNGHWDNYNNTVSNQFTYTDLKQLYKTGYEIPAHNYQTMKYHVAAVMQLKTVAAVEAYDFSSGWK